MNYYTSAKVETQDFQELSSRTGYVDRIRRTRVATVDLTKIDLTGLTALTVILDEEPEKAA